MVSAPVQATNSNAAGTKSPSKTSFPTYHLPTLTCDPLPNKTGLQVQKPQNIMLTSCQTQIGIPVFSFTYRVTSCRYYFHDQSQPSVAAPSASFFQLQSHYIQCAMYLPNSCYANLINLRYCDHNLFTLIPSCSSSTSKISVDINYQVLATQTNTHSTTL